MSYDYSKHNELKGKLKEYLMELRKKGQLSIGGQHDQKNPQQVGWLEEREGHLHGKYVKRLVIFMRGTGCAHAKETGGCTFCGFYNATNFGEKISDEDYVQQIRSTIESQEIVFSEYPIVCLYNEGSMLDEEEIGFDALIDIFKTLERQDSVKKLVIEARIEDITEEKLLRMKQVSSKDLEIAVGFESANEMIRDLCINKNFLQADFEKIVQLCASMKISIVPLLIIKPPYLTELEAIEDYVASLVYLEQFHLERIDIELPTIEKDTLVYELWQKEMYRPLWFWSMIKILRLARKASCKTLLYISPPNYSVPAEVKTSNCDNCDDLIYQAIDQFNRTKDVAAFDKIECTCKVLWDQQLQSEVWEGDIPSRIERSLKELIENNKIKS